MASLIGDVHERGGEQAARNYEAVDPERPLHHSEQPPLCRAHKFGRCHLSGKYSRTSANGHL